MSRNACANPKCREQLSLYNKRKLCPACLYLSRRVFALGAFVAGAVYFIFQAVGWVLK